MKIRYAVMEWREVEVPAGVAVPDTDAWGRVRNPEDLLRILAALGILWRPAKPGDDWTTVGDRLAVVADGEYGYEDFIHLEKD